MHTEMVTDQQRFWDLLQEAAESRAIGLDQEADVKVFTKHNGKTAIDPRTFRVVGGSLYILGHDTAYYFPFSHQVGDNLPGGSLDEWLDFYAESLLEGRERQRAWVHNRNAEVQMLANHGHTCVDAYGARDSMIAAWLLGYGGDRDENEGGSSKFEPLGLKDLRIRVLDFPARREFEDVAAGRQASEVPSHDMAEYAALDASDTLMIGETLWPRLVDKGLVGHMLLIDEPAAEICRNMECEGWDIDTESVRAFRDQMAREAAEIADRFREATTTLAVDVEQVDTPVGFYKNGKQKTKKIPTEVVHVRGGDISNDRDCARFIFKETMALPMEGTVLKDDGHVSLRKENIEHFQASHAGTLGAELVDMRFEYKKRTTLITNFATPFLHLPTCYDDSRLHSRFDHTGTATQRLSSSSPNTQNCPSRSKEGKAIRAAMIAAPGWRIGCFDMSQAELRVGAHFSKDPELVACYASEPEIDVHAGTLAALHAMGWTSATRTDSKICNFSSMYNITDKRLAIKMKCSVERARVALDAHHKRFARYWEWEEEAAEFVKEHGYVRTLDGFKRFLDNTLVYDKFKRRKDLHWKVRNRIASTAIQGSVAGMSKIAMRDIKRELVKRGLWQTHARFKAQEHDSIIVTAREGYEAEVEEIVRRHMATAIRLVVPMKIDGKWGRSWGEAK